MSPLSLHFGDVVFDVRAGEFAVVFPFGVILDVVDELVDVARFEEEGAVVAGVSAAELVYHAWVVGRVRKEDCGRLQVVAGGGGDRERDGDECDGERDGVGGAVAEPPAEDDVADDTEGARERGDEREAAVTTEHT